MCALSTSCVHSLNVLVFLTSKHVTEKPKEESFDILVYPKETIDNLKLLTSD